MPRVSGPATAGSFRRPGGDGARRLSPPPSAGPPKTFVSGSAADNPTNGTLVVNAPASITTGNLLVFVGGWDSTTGTPTLPTGWAQVGSLHRGNFASSFVAVKTATGSEPASYTFTLPTRFNAGAILQFSGPTGLDGTPGFNSGGSSTNASAPAVTAAGSDVWVVGFLDGSNGASFTTPTGFTVGPSSRTAGSESIFTFYKSVGSGSTGTAASTAAPATFWTGISALC